MPTDDDVIQPQKTKRRRTLALVAAGTVVLLVLGWVGVATVTRLLDRSVEVALPDRPARPVTPTAFDGPTLCHKYTGPTPWMLQTSEGDLTVDYADGDLDAIPRWGETTTEIEGALRANAPSITLSNGSSAPVVTRGSAGFVLIKDGSVIATPDAEVGNRESIRVDPGESYARYGGITPCLPELGVGTYLLYGVVPVTPLTDETGSLPPSTAAELVVGPPILLTISTQDDGATLTTAVSLHDPDNPQPAAPDGPPPAVVDPSTRTHRPPAVEESPDCSGEEECG